MAWKYSDDTNLFDRTTALWNVQFTGRDETVKTNFIYMY